MGAGRRADLARCGVAGWGGFVGAEPSGTGPSEQQIQAPEQVLTFRVTASFSETRTPQAVTERVPRTMEGLRTIHGVMGVATASQPPGVALPLGSDFVVAERGAASGTLRVLTRFVSREYFATLRIPILSGDLCGLRSIAAHW